MTEFDREHTFNVQLSEDEKYVIDGIKQPILEFRLGHEYLFNIDAKDCPFAVGTSVMGGNGGDGVENGTLIVKCDQSMIDVPHYYQCTTKKQLGYKIVVLSEIKKK